LGLRGRESAKTRIDLAASSAYPQAQWDQEFVPFLNLWIELKKQDNTIPALYDYWILGKNAIPKAPR
jgi:hypothetical protein